MSGKRLGNSLKGVPEEVIQARKKLEEAFKFAEEAYAKALRQNRDARNKADQRVKDKFHRIVNEAEREYHETVEKIRTRGKEHKKSFEEISEELMHARNKYIRTLKSAESEYLNGIDLNEIMQEKADKQAMIAVAKIQDEAEREYLKTIEKIGWKPY